MALAPLAPFVAALVALGLAVLLTVLVLAMVRFLGDAPVIGGWIAGKAVAAEKAIAHALGTVFAGIDAFIGGCIHNLARRVDTLGNAIEGASHAALEVAEALNPVTITTHIARAVAHATAQALHGIEHGVKTFERELRGIEHGIKRLERALERGIGHDLILQLGRLERDLTHLGRWVIPGIRGDIRAAEHEIGNIFEWAKGKASLIGVGTFGMAVAAVLEAVGLNWLACRNGPERVGRSGCGLWDDLGDVLGLLAAAELALNFETFVHDAQAAADATAVAVKQVAGLG